MHFRQNTRAETQNQSAGKITRSPRSINLSALIAFHMPEMSRL